jgi:ribosomal peptide maturation radical SAM protein 1
LIWLRQEVIPQWLNKWAHEIAQSGPTLVGFTCMFDQTIASIALAKLIKALSPETLTALGGYAVRHPTGEAILKSFPYVDIVCDGEGEPVIASLAKASIAEIPVSSVPNILYRSDRNEICRTTRTPFINLNDSPVPDYDDFFHDRCRLLQEFKIDIHVDRLPLENSRGCWWGQVKHCVFCGIEDGDLRYRYKDPDKVIQSMENLYARYGFSAFRFSDYILPHQYFKTLLPRLVDQKQPYHIISEMKANITKQQFSLLAVAGFEEVQPGIESLSNKVLRKMDKGVNAVQNVYTLLLGKYFGIAVRYNILYGLPDEDINEINAIVCLMPKLFHLDPPSTCLQIQITRFAPLQTDPDRFKIPPATYEPSYDIVFSPQFLMHSGFDLNQYCYYFERTYENAPSVSQLYKKMEELAQQWRTQQENREVLLTYRETNGILEVVDSRQSIESKVFHLTENESAIYSSIVEPVNLEIAKLRCIDYMNVDEFYDGLEHLDDLGLIFQHEEKLIGLMIAENRDKTSFHNASECDAQKLVAN